MSLAEHTAAHPSAPRHGPTVRTLRLAGGQLATLRPVRRSDAQPMQCFVRGLSPASRRQRFHAVLSGCSPAMLTTLTSVDGERQVAYVATLGDGADERIVAEARYVTTADDEGAEFALVVGDACQGQGVADALLDRLIEQARAAGLQYLFGEVMAGNARMLAFMRRRGFVIGDDGFSCVDRELGTVRVERELDAEDAPGGEEAGPSGFGDTLRRWLHSGFDRFALVPRA